MSRLGGGDDRVRLPRRGCSAPGRSWSAAVPRLARITFFKDAIYGFSSCVEIEGCHDTGVHPAAHDWRGWSDRASPMQRTAFRGARKLPAHPPGVRAARSDRRGYCRGRRVGLEPQGDPVNPCTRPRIWSTSSRQGERFPSPDRPIDQLPVRKNRPRGMEASPPRPAQVLSKGGQSADRWGGSRAGAVWLLQPVRSVLAVRGKGDAR